MADAIPYFSSKKPFVAGEAVPPLVTYEQRLNSNSRWALNEGSIFFEGDGEVQRSLRKIAAKLEELHIPYAIVGGMALFYHGVRRFTEDVDLLVTRQDLARIHEALDGLGYVPPFKGSKNLRDTETGVKIEFLITGGFPGDGKEKPVSFPEPHHVGVEHDGIRYINLVTLVELKLASGMTNPLRAKDIGDVIALVQTLKLAREFAEQLNPFVRGKFTEICEQVAREPEGES